MTCKRHGRAALARRARCVGLRSEGDRRVDARRKLGGNDAFVSTWTRAFQAQGLAGLVSWPRAARPARRWPRTSIQALDRDDRTLPLSPGRAQRHAVHDKRNGTLRLFAALDSTTGKVLGKTDKQLVAISVGTTKPIGRAPSSGFEPNAVRVRRTPGSASVRRRSQSRFGGFVFSPVAVLHSASTGKSGSNDGESMFLARYRLRWRLGAY